MTVRPHKLAVAAFFAVLFSFALNVEPASAVACSSGAPAQSSYTVSPSHGAVFYIDTGVTPVLDAGYIGYRVTNGTGSTKTDLWAEVSNFAGGKLALANSADSMMKLPTMSNGQTGVAYFMLKSTGATTTAQTHTFKVYDKRPDLAGATVLYSCDFSFAKVQETIKAAANKVANNGLTSSAAIEVNDTTPELGQQLIVTVEGQTGNIGTGSSPDLDIFWMTPAAVSTWPTRALRLESVSALFDGNGNWATTGDQVSYTDQLLLTSTNGSAIDGSQYRLTYTFRVVGQPTSTVKIVPVAQIASGTQVKHSDTGAAGATVDITFSALAVNASLTKSVTNDGVTPGPALTVVNCSGACVVPGGAGNGMYVEVPYRLAASSTTTTTLTIDEFVDKPPTGIIFKPGSATVTDIGRTAVAIADPVTVTAEPTPKPLHFIGPFTMNSATTARIDYKMYVPVGSFANTAYAKIGDFLVGATASAMSRITVTSTGTGTIGVVSDTVSFSVAAVTNPATAITSSAATLNGTVDPNGAAVLTGQFEYGTSPTLTGATTVTATTPVSGALGGLTDPTAVSVNLTGLSSGTTYYYRVIAGSAQGSILSFTTQAVVAPPTVTTTAATSIAATSATLNGTINPNLTNVTGIQFIYSTSPTLSSGNVTTTVDDGTGTAALTAGGSSLQPFSKAVTGLTTGTTYYYKIRACTGALSGTYPNVTCSTFVDGAILSFVAAGAPTVTTNAATSVGTTTATLNGTINANGGTTATTFQYSTVADLSSGVTTVTATTPVGGTVTGTTNTAASVNVTGLTAGTTYYFRAVGTNGSGTTNGSILSFTTTALIPNLSTSTKADNDVDNTVTPGQVITYTVTIINTGNTTGTGVSVTDTLNTNLQALGNFTFSNCGVPTNSSTSSAVNVTGISVAVGTNCVITFQATVKTPTNEGTTITNTATISAAAQGGSGATPSSDTLTVDATPVLSTSTLADNDADNIVSRLQTVTYTLTIKNTGNGQGTGISATTGTIDTDLQSLTVTGTTNCGSPTNSSTSTALNVTGITVAVGTDCVITYTAQVKNTAAADATIPMSVTVSAATQGGSGATPSADTLTVYVLPDLSTSTKADNDADNTVTPGQLITYTVTVINSGGTTATGVSVTDTLDTDLENLSNFTFAGCGVPSNSSTSAAVNVTGITVTTSANCVITFQASVKNPRNEGVTITNTATISAATEGGSGATPSSDTLTVDATPVLSTSTLADNDADNYADRLQTVTYTLTIKNTGNGQGTGISATTGTIDTDIENLSVTGTTNCGSPTNSSTSTALNVTGITVAVGTNCVITYTVQVKNAAAPNATVPMSATVSAATEGGSGATPSADTLTVYVAPNFSTSTKTSNGTTTVYPGQVITYTITVINTGSATGTGVSISDTVDTDLENVTNLTASNCGAFTNTSTSSSLNLSFVSIAPSQNCVVTFQATVKATTLAGATILNTATISTASEGGTGGSPSTPTATVNTIPDLSTSTKADNDADNVVSPLQTVTYTVTVKNTGVGTGTGISVTDTLDTDLENLSVTGTTNCGSPTDSSTSTALNVTGITVTTSANCVITFTASVKATATTGSTIPNAATISAAAEGGSGSTPSSDTLTVDATPNLSTSTKTENDADNVVTPGQAVTYTITIPNTGTGPASGVSVTDTLDGRLESLTSVNTTNCGSPTNSSTSTALNLTGVSIAAGASCVITFQASVKSTALYGDVVANSATISAATEGGTGASPSSTSLTVQYVPNLSTSTKADNDADNTVTPGQVITFTVTVKNTGVGTATGVSVTDTLDTDLENLGGFSFANCGIPSNTSSSTAVNVTGVAVAVGTDCVITFQANVKTPRNEGTTITNTATISAATQGGSGATPSSDTLTVDATPNLSTSTLADNDADNFVNRLQTVTYTLTIKNTGNGQGTGISATTGTIDTDLQSLAVTGTTNCGSPTNSSTSTALNVTGITVAVGTDCVITYTAQVTNAAAANATAPMSVTISAASEGGAGATPSADTLTVYVAPNLSTSTKADNDADNVVDPGQTVTFTVTLINTGGVTATGVSVTDTLDSDLENLTNFTFSGCGVLTNASTAGAVNITGITVTTSVNCVITFQATVKSPAADGAAITNTATISAAAEGGSGATPSSDSLSLNVTPNLSTSTKADNDADNIVVPGQDITYTITLLNTGTGSGTGISVTDTLDTDLENLSSVTFSNCGSPTNSSTSTALNVTNVTAGISTNCVITFHAFVKTPRNEGTTITNTATISAATQGGSGATPSSDTLTVDATPNLSTSTKADNDADNSVTPGQAITFTVTVKNTGNGQATGVSVTDTLDADLENLSSVTFSNCGSPTNSSTSSALNVTGITVAVGTDCVITFQASVKNPRNEGTSITNTATISAATEGGSGASPSSDALTVDVTPNLSTSTKTEGDSDDAVALGDGIVYTITIKNTGNGQATGVSVTDTLDTDAQGVGSVNFTDCGSPTNSSTSSALNVTGITVAVGTNCVITFQTTVSMSATIGGTVTNTATISAAAEGGVGGSPSATPLALPTVGAGSGVATPSGASVVINGGASCSATNAVTLALQVTDATHVLLSNDPNFIGASWQAFTGSPMSAPWTLAAGDGTRTVYAMFKNSDKQSLAVSDAITVDAAGSCGTPAPPSSGPAPTTPAAPVTDFSAASYDLYIVNPDGTERHMGDPRFARIERVSATVDIIRFEDKGVDFDFDDVVLQVDHSDWTRVVVTAVGVDAGWLHNVRMTVFNGGVPVKDLMIWPDSHLGVGQYALINVNDGGAFVVGSPVIPIVLPPHTPYVNPKTGIIPPLPPSTTVPPKEGVPAGDASKEEGGEVAPKPDVGDKEPPAAVPQGPMCAPVACEDVDYDLYIVNPDGTERHMGTRYVSVASVGDGRILVGFEDSGQDFDYNDVRVLIDKKDCASVTFEVLGLSARWHHRMILDVFHKNRKAFNALIWEDTHAASGDVQKVNAKDHPAMCGAAGQAPVSPVPKPAPSAGVACALQEPFTANVPAGSRGRDVVRLQDILRCLGHFPADVDSTGVYGFVTQKAVTDFQTSRGITPQTGSVGPRTRAALNAYASR